MIRQLRDLTRYRSRLLTARTSKTQRVDKLLEGAGVKLSSVASPTLGVSGRLMVAALIAGARDPEALAEHAKGRLRGKLPQLRRALAASRFGDHHTRLLRIQPDHIDHLDGAIAALDEPVDTVLAPFADTLAECAGAAARTKDSHLQAQFWQIARRRGKERAAVAVGHAILVAAHHMRSAEVGSDDPGGDVFARRLDPATRRLVRQLEQLGHTVTLESAA